MAAYAGSGATLNADGNISITATATNSATATTYGISAAGGLAIGTSTTTASANGSAIAHIDGTVTGCDNLTVQATATDSSDAEATAFAGGIVAGEGAAGTATTSPTVQAYTGIKLITVTNAMLVKATVTPTATAKALGVAVAGVGIGASVTNATAAPVVQGIVGITNQITFASDPGLSTGEAIVYSAGSGTGIGGLTSGAKYYVIKVDATHIMLADSANDASLDNPITLTTAGSGSFSAAGSSFSGSNATTSETRILAGSLTVMAGQGQDSSNDPTTYASSVGGAGGVLLGITATTATASDLALVQAYTGANVLLPDGNVAIMAMNQTEQSANATAGAAGLIGVGSSTATATSGVTTLAQLGAGAMTDIARTGSLTVDAAGTDQNNASSTAGSRRRSRGRCVGRQHQ